MTAQPPPSPAQFLWIGSRLSTIERLCLQSFVDQGWQVHLYTYGPVSGIPAGIRSLHADEIIPSSEIFACADGFGRGSHAGFADLFRYELLHRRGGWWFDMDFVSIRRMRDPEGPWIASSFEGKWGACANVCAMHSPPRHPLFECLRTRSRRIVSDGNMAFGSIGPALLQQTLKDLSLTHCVAPWYEFSPYPWRQIYRIALTDLRAVIKDRLRLARFVFWQLTRGDFKAGYIRRNTRALHLHNEIWRTSGIDKDAKYHPFSLYERLKRRHGVC